MSGNEDMAYKCKVLFENIKDSEYDGFMDDLSNFASQHGVSIFIGVGEPE